MASVVSISLAGIGAGDVRASGMVRDGDQVGSFRVVGGGGGLRVRSSIPLGDDLRKCILEAHHAAQLERTAR
jgi:hypothetical protein